MKYDVVVIGFGKAGKTLSGALAKQGRKVALVERSNKMYGGTCINVGCIPSKSLVGASAAARLSGETDWSAKAERYEAAIAQKRKLTDMLRGKNYKKLADLPGVTIYDGVASFAAAHTVEVKTQEGTELLEAPQILINTGATPVIPNIPGVKTSKLAYTSEGLMELDTLPRNLVIVGGGYVGLEFASIYAGFGSKVTVLQDGDRFVPREDEDIAAEMRAMLEDGGVTIRTGVAVERIGDDPKAAVLIRANGAEETLPADAVLIATGRRANTDDLHCEKAGVELTPRGAVKVDGYLRTNVEGVWAAGDVAGGLQFTYISLDDYRILLPQFLGKEPERDTAQRNVPYSVFLSTPFARVGLNEQEAAKAGLSVTVKKLPAAAIPKAQVLQNPRGLLKALVDNNTGRIVGAMLLCEEAYEMINIVKLAMDLGSPATALRDMIFTHPTMSEALNDLFA